jgi:hypothetical protein
MDSEQFGAEMREAGKNRPRGIDPDSQHFRDYDVELEANGHTYRRRRDGKGWCRFSPGPEECGIPNEALPNQVQQNIPETAASQQAAGAQQVAPTTGQPTGPQQIAPASTSQQAASPSPTTTTPPTGVPTAARPTPRQSELDALAQNPGHRPQVSYKNGREVPYGTKGSSRPDGFTIGPPPEALEVKNYDVLDPANRANLYETVQAQYRRRLGNLPSGTRQVFILDLRGQTVSDALLIRLRRNILTVTSSSVAEVRFLL